MNNEELNIKLSKQNPNNQKQSEKNSKITKNENIKNEITSKNDNISTQNIGYYEKVKSLGINIGSFKTVYSVNTKKNEKFVSEVLLMNDYSRIIPSIICYTKTHRLFGENSLSFLKQNLNTSYNNLSRIIGYDKNLKVFKDEKLFNFNTLENTNNPYEFIIADFLSLINDYFYDKSKIEYTSTSISVPDFYTFNQKNKLKLICESIGMKGIKIINESTAISMYYIYNQYNNFFTDGEGNIYFNSRNILFIDAGHSKTSFILSKFKYNEFKVEYVLCDDNLGGRNFDELIFNYCIEEFEKENELTNIEITDIMKYKLMIIIPKERIKLSVNTEVSIYVDVFYNDIDLNIILTRDKFDELIKDVLYQFKNMFNNILDYIKEKKINIDKIEMAGGLMRTPSLQKIIEKNYILSKTILIDECTSIGASLYEYSQKKIEQNKKLKIYNFNYYPIYYNIIDNNITLKEGIFLENKVIEKNPIISINIDDYKKYQNPILKLFYFSDINNKFDENIILETNLLFSTIKSNNIKKKDFPIQYEFILNNIVQPLKMIIKTVNEVIKEKEINLNDNDIKKIELKRKIEQHLKEQKIIDKKYNYFIQEKSNISYLLILIKNNVEKNKMNFNNEFKQIQIINKTINKNENNLEELIKNKMELNEITKQLYLVKKNEFFKKNKYKDNIIKINNLEKDKDDYLKKYIELINIENKFNNNE